MTKELDLSKTVYELWKENPEIVDIMKSLGFEVLPILLCSIQPEDL